MNIEIINGKPYQMAPENTLYTTRERLQATLTEVQSQLADVNAKIAIQEEQTLELQTKEALTKALDELKVVHNKRDSLETIEKIAQPYSTEIAALKVAPEPEEGSIH